MNASHMEQRRPPLQFETYKGISVSSSIIFYIPYPTFETPTLVSNCFQEKHKLKMPMMRADEAPPDSPASSQAGDDPEMPGLIQGPNLSYSTRPLTMIKEAQDIFRLLGTTATIWPEISHDSVSDSQELILLRQDALMLKLETWYHAELYDISVENAAAIPFNGLIWDRSDEDLTETEEALMADTSLLKGSIMDTLKVALAVEAKELPVDDEARQGLKDWAEHMPQNLPGVAPKDHCPVDCELFESVAWIRQRLISIKAEHCCRLMAARFMQLATYRC